MIRRMDGRRTLAIAGILIALASAFGALGAHALKAQLSQDKLQVYETAVRYHFLHALGLLAIGILLRTIDSGALRGSAVLILAGIILFSGSLYLLIVALAVGYAAVLLLNDALDRHAIASAGAPANSRPSLLAALARHRWYWLPPIYGLALIVLLIVTHGQDAGAAQFMYRRF